jgi:hypothetical protein
VIVFAASVTGNQARHLLFAVQRSAALFASKYSLIKLDSGILNRAQRAAEHAVAA